MESKSERIELLERTIAVIAKAGWPEEWETVIKVAAAQAESEMSHAVQVPKVSVETIIVCQNGKSKEVIEVKK